jgi:glycosyltransferase involved in cell wall biosynthesis
VKRGIVMIGPRRDVRGGISAMVNVCFDHGLFERWRARYLATHRDGSKPLKAWQAARSLAIFLAWLLAGRVALLHVHIASDASFWRKALFIVPARLLGVPYLLHMHGGSFIDFYRARSRPVQRFIRWVYGGARCVIALSEEWRSALSTMQPASRIRVIANPIAIPPWRPAPDGAPPRVLFLGVVCERKGVHDLLRAWPAVLRRVPDARLVLAGSGDVDAARALAGKLGIEESVETPGWVLGDDKARLLNAATAFTLPSHFEALPMSVLEAMAAGLPVVATRVGGVPTAIDDRRTGILLEPRDVEGLARALTMLLTDAQERRRMGEAARRAANERFSADILIPRLEALWGESAPGCGNWSPRPGQTPMPPTGGCIHIGASPPGSAKAARQQEPP